MDTNNSLPSKNVFLALCFVFLLLGSTNAITNKIDLSGKWSFKIDSTDVGIVQKWYAQTFEDQINLPGTLDEGGFGLPNKLQPKLEMPQILYLTRKHSYIGVAWYSRELAIPQNWKQKSITLKLERVLWESRVWVDGIEVNSKQESLIAPHYFKLTEALTPGKHIISIRIDNRKKYDISVPTINSPNGLAHAYSEETQTIWNGVIGEIACIANDRVNIADIQVFPNVDTKSAYLKVIIENSTKKSFSGKLILFATSLKDSSKLPLMTISVNTKKRSEIISVDYSMGKDVQLWDEFTPNLYSITAQLTGNRIDESVVRQFGMRKLTNKNARIQMNGRPIFLRGTLECCIFPKTAHPPMDKKGWEKVFKTAKEWGLNHLRFHSWCPPRYAFEVADEMGFYLQVELPLWSLTVNKDTATNRFINDEANRIIKEYGNHPSFCFLSIGNELQPDFNYLNAFVDRLKKADARHLYTNTSYTFEKGHGTWPEPNDDFYITQFTKKGWVRGQGIFGSESPRFNKDYSVAIDSIPVPIITHEIGQYSVYPNLNEIDKYTGVLDPLNFKAVKADLKKKGLLPKAHDYLMASGKFAAILYKEEIERALKTQGLSGFQLLDLHDFPGQGTALVGLLDAFWDSKGLISSANFREFNSSVVPLFRFQKPVFQNNETFNAEVELSYYSTEKLDGKKMIWEITDKSGLVLKTGYFTISNLVSGKIAKIGNITCPLNFLSSSQQIFVKCKIENSVYQNCWKLWVYTAEAKPEFKTVVYTRNAAEAEQALAKGKMVLYNPDWKKLKGIEGKFLPVFWSPVHFPKQAATMGILCDPSHPALAQFPTDMHSDWQWWDLNTNSKTIILDSIPQVKPIVEMVDNWVNNRRLASVFEAKVGPGKLIYSSIDLSSDLNNRPQAKQLLISFLAYMNSTAFNPSGEITFSKLRDFDTEVISDKKGNATDIY